MFVFVFGVELTMAVVGVVGAEVLIPLAALIGIAFAVFQWFVVSRVKVPAAAAAAAAEEDAAKARLRTAESEVAEVVEDSEEAGVDYGRVEAKCAQIQDAISIGATSFLLTEYRYTYILAS